MYVALPHGIDFRPSFCAACSSLWLSRLLAHWLMMDTRSFGTLAGGLHYALLIHGKPLFSTNASRLRFSDLTQYAWPTHF